MFAGSQIAWATVDSSWVTTADPAKLGQSLDEVRRLQPSQVLSSHLPPMCRALDRAVAALRTAPHADPVPGLTQHELEALLARFEPATTQEKETADV